MIINEPPWPLNELARVDKLKGYGILDTPPDPAFDRLTRLGARHFGVPTALVSLVDEGRQWFKSRCGFEATHTPRRLAFCAYTILEDRVMVVPDTRLDERFADNDLVTGPPHLRFYAGAPLKTGEGLLLGTFCVIDYKPHLDFSEPARRDLEEFARIVMHELDTRAARQAEQAARLEAERAQAQLRESNALFESVMENTTDAMFVKAPDGRYVAVNSAAARAFGLARDEMLGRLDIDLIPAPAAAFTREVDLRVMATGRSETVEEALPVAGHGSPRIFSTAKTPLRSAEGTVVGVVGIARDVTDRKRTEDALRSSEVRFRTLVENAPQMMWVNRPDGTLDLFNALWRSYTGHGTSESARWDDVHPDDRPRIKNLRARAIATGEPYEYEMRLRRADGAYRWHVGRVNPLREGGRIIAWVGTAMDVDDFRRAQEAAEEANRSKSRFLAAASHDLRQPLQSILLFAEALRPHIADARGNEVLAHLHRGLDALKGLLDGLLDVSRLDAGIVQPQIEEFPVAEVIQQLGAAYAPIAEGKGLAWQVAPTTAVVRSDRVLLARMLRNLVENALRYTERGRVMLDCDVQGTRLRIEVRDTGMGIPPDQLGRIFEEFHQVGNPERDREQGLGLGLAIVRRLSRLLDHPVQVHSRLGSGSTFSVEVPLAAHARPASVPPPCPAGESPAGAGRFAVVVDDDAIVLLGLRMMLQDWGYDVLMASSTDQAMDALEASHRRPDIVLVDYRLREERVGTEAVVRIRDRFGAGIPGIILTGEIGPEPQRDAVAHGLGLIHKPVTPRLLAAALADQLQGAD